MSEDRGEDVRREAIIDALLPQVPFDGWTVKSLRQALAAIGEPPEDAPLYFPDGAGEMIEAFCALADARMETASAEAGLAAFRVPGRIRSIIGIRLEQNRANKEAIRRALSWLAMPVNAPRALRITAATVDAIWHAAGDRASDFSWYTKRGILAGVYSATLLYWLRDSSEDDEASLAFLDRRLENVAAIGKIRGKFAARIDGLKRRTGGFARPPG
jgi:ubiquinone biosynthesis protein COQ9